MDKKIDDHELFNNRSFIVDKENFNSNVIISNLRLKLTKNSSFIKCPFCSYESLTIVTKSINFIAILYCISSLVILWIIIQKFRGKELTFFNVEHRCLKCESKIAEINAC